MYHFYNYFLKNVQYFKTFYVHKYLQYKIFYIYVGFWLAHLARDLSSQAEKKITVPTSLLHGS